MNNGTTERLAWLRHLPPLRGKIETGVPMKNYSWFRVGGPAEILFQPADAQDLAAFLKACPDDVPVTVVGIGSNLLIRDGGIDGVVIRLGPAFGLVSVEGEILSAGAGAVDLKVSRAAQQAGLAGLEFLCGIPGTLGGGLRMNAGAYGRELKDILLSVEAATRGGEIITLTPADMGHSYRRCAAPADLIFLSAKLQGQPGDPAAIDARMKEIMGTRSASQPIHEKTSGSTFANPDGFKAWELIDKAGCRGLRVGGAMMSDKHCNFMINTGDATAKDLETLGEEVRRRVKETSGQELRWEVKRIGRPSAEGEGHERP